MGTTQIGNGWIDTHFHTREMAGKGIDVHTELTTAADHGMVTGIDIGVDLENIDMRLAFIKPFPKIGYSLGLSPHEAESGDIGAKLTALKKAAEFHNPVAIGEIGLDWHWNYGTRERQIELFTGQLDIADKLNLPVIIHNRLADVEMLDIVNRSAPSRGGIMHCFSSNYENASAFIECGFLISFAGNLTYKRSADIQDAAKRIPLSSTLCETDSPYLAPQPKRGTLNVPANVVHVYEALATLRDESVSKVASQVSRNFGAMFEL